MRVTYDQYYQKENLFGDSYPELVAFFAAYPIKGKVLDLGCGQGRNAIALARMGYTVLGIDNSKVGIDQMNEIAAIESLNAVGQVSDMYAFDRFCEFDIVLLDSMFHFTKKDKEKEVCFIKKIISESKQGSIVVVCLQDTGDKVSILNQALDFEKEHSRLRDKKFTYTFEDNGHISKTNYKMVVIEK